MFHKPAGHAENIMMYTAPIVYGMYYLQKSGQETAENEMTGTEYFRYGMNCLSSSLSL